jgi:hypothetical protein
MTTPQITGNSLKKFPFVGVNRTKKDRVEHTLPCQFTLDELHTEIEKAVEARKEGRFISHEEMGRRIASWR